MGSMQRKRTLAGFRCARGFRVRQCGAGGVLPMGPIEPYRPILIAVPAWDVDPWVPGPAASPADHRHHYLGDVDQRTDQKPRTVL